MSSIVSMQTTPAGFACCRESRQTLGADGQLDLNEMEARFFEIVLAAPHSQLRKTPHQTRRLIAAIVKILRFMCWRIHEAVSGSRAGIAADWDAVFNAASRQEGWPSRSTATRRGRMSTTRWPLWRSGPTASLPSTATPTPRPQLAYAETALAHARLAGIPPERLSSIVGRLTGSSRGCQIDHENRAQAPLDDHGRSRVVTTICEGEPDMKRTTLLVGAATLLIGIAAGALWAQQQPQGPQPFFVGNRLGLPINPAADGTFEPTSSM